LSPHECQAEAERSAALALGKLLRELEQAISAAANGAKSALQDRVRALKAEQLAYEPGAKAAQAHRDAVYWPICNLDIKAPNAKAGLEHADPKDLTASMRGREAEVMRLLGEIEALVNQVQA
jgi:type I restriction enzyme M protein